MRSTDLITDGCEPPCGCWELNSGPLEEQAMLLTAEPSLQPPNKMLLCDNSYIYLEASSDLHMEVPPKNLVKDFDGLLLSLWLAGST